MIANDFIKVSLVVLLFVGGVKAFAQPSKEQYDSIIELAAEGKVEAAQLKLNTYLEIWPDNADLKAMAKQLEGMASPDDKLRSKDPREDPRKISLYGRLNSEE